MSLINQVLQDLDRRHASGAAMPAAVKALARPVAAGGRWRVTMVTLAAVLVVGGGAGAVAWSMALKSVEPAMVQRTAQAVAAPTPTPVMVVAARTPSASGPLAPPAEAKTAMAAVVAPKPGTTEPVARNDRVAPAKASGEMASDMAPVPRGVLASAPASLPTSVPVKPSPLPALTGESRIEKRAPSRTAHERAEAEYQRGVGLHQAGQYAEAAVAYTAALHEESTLIAARQALAGALMNQGKTDDARTVLTDGLAIAPQNTGLAMTLARLHVERGELQRAAEVLQPTDTASMSAEDHAFRAAVLQRINRHPEASDHFAAALRTVPNNGVWWMGLAISQAADGHGDNAKEAFNRARSSGSLTPELAQYVEQRLRQL